jgi:hypothetical protein
MNIPTDINNKRYIYKCECNKHTNCNFNGEAIDPVVPYCKGKCHKNKCDSIQSRMYNPNNLTKEKLSNMEYGDILKKHIKEKDILKPLKKKLNL